MEKHSTLLSTCQIDWERAFADPSDTSTIELADGQRQAVRVALTDKVSVLTGGPGVGKTTTLRAILRLLNRYGIEYCLTAPTGRAAKRMNEATGCQASTIHRLLKFNPGLNEFRHNDQNPLPYSFVIVDESSMIDILLFHALLKAIPPTAHLLLVGDADQLPSVGPGNVLRDIIASRVPAVTRLTQLFRQAKGSRITIAARAINRGEVPRFEHEGETDLFFIRDDDPDRVLKLLRTVVAERIPRAFGLDPLADVQVISPSNRGPLGVDNLNIQLQELLNPARPGDLLLGQRVFRPGDKVMQIRNDYEKNVFNGDMGRVARIDHDGRVVIVRYLADDGDVIEVPYKPDEMNELKYAYAISVHKSQGGEFPAVVIPLTTSHYRLLQRNLIYTAITRARRLCVLIGSPRALEIAVRTSAVDQRYTALVERLRGILVSHAVEGAELVGVEEVA